MDFLSRFFAIVLLFSCLTQCRKKVGESESLQTLVSDVEHINGKSAYLNTPYITAGDRVYMVGTQDGAFPELGWHVTGEMGGIWDHPIKLMDGFVATITSDNRQVCLMKADTFTNFPFANKHIFRSGLKDLVVERFQFVPDGKEAVVIEFNFTNTGNDTRKFTFDFTGYSDLRPVWLGERTSMVDGQDIAVWEKSSQSWVVKDSLNDWYVQFGSNTAPEKHSQGVFACDYKPKGKGAIAAISYSLEIAAGASLRIPITVSGSYESAEKAGETFAEVQKDAAKMLTAKKQRYASISEKSKLTIPDKELEEAFRWVKYDTDWLVRDVPAVGRGLSAGAPDYPWWFGADSEYALKGLIATGQPDLVYSAIAVLDKLSEKTNGNGRIIHEASTNGAVYNPGNVNETPQFASLIAAVYAWTGDKEFLKKYFPVIKKGLNWLLKENDKDGNLLPDGFGMMEIHGMDSEMTDVAAYTQKAFADASYMAMELGDSQLSAQYKTIAGQLRTLINQDFWVPESNSFADFIGTPVQAIRLIDDAIVRADTLKKPWAVAELKAAKSAVIRSGAKQKKGFVVHHNWVVNTPMETGIADSAKALAALETASKFTNPFGAFVTGIDRDESAGKDERSVAGNNKVFTYTGAVMTLPTGVLAISENNYGQPDNALSYLRRMTKSFSFALPGSIYEVSPDYGMMSQAWNVYSYAVPIVQQFFGVNPESSKKTIHFQPQMPSKWNDAKLENVIVGNNELDIVFKRSGKAEQWDLTQTKDDWKVMLTFPKNKFNNWRVNGKNVQPRQQGLFDMFEVTGSNISLSMDRQ
ncbi:glycogen debranching protein [Dyadobacter arcticus]|uniref:Glycogen debranching enzyme n=1 Tax=Dyadobacter arcticus TaxID=1078754 RepID=A0ABX0UKE0_9BACT|nr:glycogen debranching protein [Dyadobacter arcticus]NIJ52479.1 glycogen debranching enzyme [Dyadobacter arcticus]